MGKRQQGFTLLELMAVIAIIGILAAMAISSYQEYMIRAQVTEGLTLSGNIRRFMVGEYLETGEWPNNNNLADLANLNQIEGSYTKSVKVQGNVLTVMFGNKANQKIFHQKITIEITENDGQFNWTCKGHAQFPDRYLPPICKT